MLIFLKLRQIREILQWSTQKSILIICFHIKIAISVSFFFFFWQPTNYQIWKCYLISQIFLFSCNKKTWQKQPVILQLTNSPALRVGKHIAISVCKTSIGIISYGRQMFMYGLLMNEKELFKCKETNLLKVASLRKAWAWRWNERPDYSWSWRELKSTQLIWRKKHSIIQYKMFSTVYLYIYSCTVEVWIKIVALQLSMPNLLFFIITILRIP